MKKIALLLAALILSGCVTVKIPKYIKDTAPYTKKFYANFEDALAAARQALGDEGWKISEVANPAIFEQTPATDPNKKQIVIFTETRQTPFIFSSRYMTVNVFLRNADDGTDVEVRYAAVTPMLFKNTNNYKNDPVVNKILNRISELLNK